MIHLHDSAAEIWKTSEFDDPKNGTDLNGWLPACGLDWFELAGKRTSRPRFQQYLKGRAKVSSEGFEAFAMYFKGMELNHQILEMARNLGSLCKYKAWLEST